MNYGRELVQARFVERLNRFLAIVRVDRSDRECFVPDPGRLEELLVEGAEIYVRREEKPDRKTGLDLILVRTGRSLVCIDSRMPNKLLPEALKEGRLEGLEGYSVERAEVTYGHSRLDFLLRKGGENLLVEAKSCTLARGRTGLFPDAPTERGARHMRSLLDAVEEGRPAAVVVIAQRYDVDEFSPFEERDPDFARALREAVGAGVRAHAYRCRVTTRYIKVAGRIPVRL